MDLITVRKGIEKLKDYTERNGVSSAFFRTAESLKEAADDRIYSEEALMLPEIRGEEVHDGPLLSLIIPVCDPDPDDFAHLLDSLVRQVYRNFEVVITDGGSTRDIENVVRAYDDDPETGLDIRYEKLSENRGISGNTNAALERARGDYVVFIDHDDFIEADALLLTVEEIDKGAELIYTDEDKYDALRDRYLRPNRKGDFNLDLLLSNNYICHMLTVKKELIIKAGLLRSGFDGAQDHDLLLRLSEIIKRDRISHIPKVLYHWRMTENSTAGNPESKLYAYENGKRAVEDYYKRRGLRVTVSDSAHRGFFLSDYREAEADPESYIIFTDKKLLPLTPEYKKALGGYFVREEIGIVGARIIGHTGRTVSNGYIKDSNGRRIPEYGKIDYRFSGYMHRASMARETEAVSIHAFAIRKELKDLIDRDPFTMCRNVREKGYTVVVDPNILFKIR